MISLLFSIITFNYFINIIVFLQVSSQYNNYIFIKYMPGYSKPGILLSENYNDTCDGVFECTYLTCKYNYTYVSTNIVCDADEKELINLSLTEEINTFINIINDFIHYVFSFLIFFILILALIYKVKNKLNISILILYFVFYTVLDLIIKVVLVSLIEECNELEIHYPIYIVKLYTKMKLINFSVTGITFIISMLLNLLCIIVIQNDGLNKLETLSFLRDTTKNKYDFEGEDFVYDEETKTYHSDKTYEKEVVYHKFSDKYSVSDDQLN